LEVAIVDATIVAAASTGGDPLPAPTALFRALLDTGAQKTMISGNAVRTVGLNPIGKIPLQGIGPNITYHDGYLFHVAFTFQLPPGLVAVSHGPAQPRTRDGCSFVRCPARHGYYRDRIT
jgi:hypothetical protein